MASNSENEVWNENHQGARVPVNDTFVAGAPFQLNGSTEWDDGCVARAVYETHIIRDDIVPPVFSDDTDAQTYQLHFSSLLKYINHDMLYGYSGDARYKRPGNLLAFRGYPTPILTVQSWTVQDATGPTEVLIDGSAGSVGSGSWIVMGYQFTIKYPLPYDLIFTLQFYEGINLEGTYTIRIESGSRFITHYRVPHDPQVQEEPNPWIVVAENKAWFSVDSAFYTGNITLSANPTNILQAPYYGTIGQFDTVVTEAEYNPGGGGGNAAQKLFGGAWYGWNESQLLARITQCREIAEKELDLLASPYILYLKTGDTLQIGTTLYQDKDATITGAAGNYLWATWGYFDSIHGDIYLLNDFLTLDSAGKIVFLVTDIETDNGFLESNCYSVWWNLFGPPPGL